MKVCSRCKVEKDVSFFGKRKWKGVTSPSAYCKECISANTKEWREENSEYVARRLHNRRPTTRIQEKQWVAKKYKDGKYRVYLLPEEHYCGQTEMVEYRIGQHTYSNKITEGMEIFGSYNTRKEAKLVEAQFHALGWYGRNLSDKKFCLNSWQYEN